MSLCAAVVMGALAAACGGSDTAAPAEAKRFTDPEAHYSLAVPGHWLRITEDLSGLAPFRSEIHTGWVVAEAADGFSPNVIIATTPKGGLSLAEFLDLSVRQGPQLMEQFEVLHVGTAPGGRGRVGVLEYSAVDDGRPLRFLAVIATDPGTAVVATLTAPPNRFAQLRAEVEPYLLTLRRE